jgi:hypothetical protein
LRSMSSSSALRKALLAGGVFAGLIGTALGPALSAQAPGGRGQGAAQPAMPASWLQVSKDGMPNLASIEFAWLADGADWMDPPAGTAGHGRIKNDPAHPFLGNVDAIRSGRQPTLRIGDAKDPVLKPWAAKVMADSNEEALTGKLDVPFAAQARCWPGGVPGQLLYPAEPIYFIQTPKEVWIIWQRDHMVRRVFLRDKHSTNLTPQSFGESIGHYEGSDTLVVDTIALATKNNYIDNFRTPHTTKEHVVERFTISTDGKTLSALVTVDDPDTFNEPIHMKQTWHKVANPLLETICAEGNYNYFNQKLFPMPEATKTDF